MFDLPIDRYEPSAALALALKPSRTRRDAALVEELTRENRTVRALFDRMVRAHRAGDEPMRVATLSVFSACLRAHLSKESRYLYPFLESTPAARCDELAALIAEMHLIGRTLRILTRDAQSLARLHGDFAEVAELLERRAEVGEKVLYPLYVGAA